MQPQKKAAVIGYPVAHSLSPVIHNYWLNHYAIKGSYQRLEVVPEDVQSTIDSLFDQGYVGANITLPFKQTVLDFVDDISATVKAVGAVNTLVINEQGRLFGDNTDVYGFIENIKRSCETFTFTQGPAMVLGAGGAARAVVYGLLEQGVPLVKLCNRTQEKAQQLAEDIGGPIEVIPWDQRQQALNDVMLLVNTTSLGMTKQPPLDIALDHLPPNALVTDIVYSPLHTDLLKQAQQRGNAIVDGLGMLLYQAVPGFKAWFGVTPEVTEQLRTKVLSA